MVTIFCRIWFEIEYIKGFNNCITNSLVENTMEKSLYKIINDITMCSKGQALLLKGNEITHDGLAMIDDAQEELSKLCPDKSLKSHPKVQPSEQNMSNILKMINFKDLM